MDIESIRQLAQVLKSMSKANSSSTDLSPVLEGINNDILIFLENQPDYLYFFEKNGWL